MLCDITRYLCSCQYEWASQLREDADFSINHHIGALYFCPQCHLIRCEECSEVSIVSKFCARCMKDFTENAGQTRCLRNCFECPVCTSPVDVKGKDETGEEGSGKRFYFTCVYCPFTYTTGLITRPASLQMILKRELPRLYANVVAKYTAMHKLNNQLQDDRQKMEDSQLRRLKQMKIKQLSALSDSESLAEQLSSHPATNLTCEVPPFPLQPRGARLSSKQKIKCSTCQSELLSPVPDFQLMKILCKQYASDIIPQLIAKCHTRKSDFVPGEDVHCSISIINNLASSINVELSILGKVPASLTPHNIEVALPLSRVSLKGKRDKSRTIDAIPSVILSSKTKAAEAERVMRDSQFNPSEGLSEDGANWATLPFTLTLDELGPVPALPLRVPFHIKVETKLPDGWKQHSSKRGLRFSFWAVTEIQSSFRSQVQGLQQLR